MPEINQTQAKEFLMDISKKDNIAIIHHDDADGFCSGIIFQDHCKSLGAATKTFSYNFSKTDISKLPLKSFNKIIITDISTKAIQEEIKSIKHKTIFLTDHHPKFPLPKEILALITIDQGYIPSSRTAYELTGQKKWLAMIGTISDAGNLYKENDHFINSFLKEEKLTLEEFQTNCSHIFSDTIIYFANTPDKLFPTLAKISSLQEIQKLQQYADKIEKEIQKITKECNTKREKLGNANFYYIEPKYQIKGIVAAILSRENPDEPHILVSPKKSNKKTLSIATRHQSPDANLPKLLEAATKNLPDSTSGGHPRASGGQIRAKDLEQFKQNIKDCNKT